MLAGQQTMNAETRIHGTDPWERDPLAYLLAPHDTASFLADVYEQAPLVVRRNQPERFSGLLSIAAIDRLIAGTDLKEGQIDLANAAANLSRSDYIDAGGYADRGAIANLYRQGATIILQQLHALDPVLSRFCAAMEAVFSCHVQTNIYLTPPSNQGFRTHYDNHDVFVVQLAGQKDWRFYNSFETPYRGEGFDSRAHLTGEVTHAFTLSAGDVAYVPRGLMHDARTSGDEPSLHITMGVMVKTWAELMLEAVSEVALREPMLRRSLPPGFARQGFERDALRPGFARMAALIGQELRLDPALDLFADTFIRSRGADTRGAIAGAGRPVDGTSVLLRRPNAPWRTEVDGQAVRIVTAGGARAFPVALAPALERALDGSTFTLADLPGDLAANQAACAELLSYGVLQRH
jgi:bifunctional lysine-specific demethylase and histidyl-hydroxylase NO66